MSETEPTYEELYRELERTVAELEAGALPLEQALRFYERGVVLAAQCQLLLDNAELRVQQVMNGELSDWQPE